MSRASSSGFPRRGRRCAGCAAPSHRHAPAATAATARCATALARRPRVDLRAHHALRHRASPGRDSASRRVVTGSIAGIQLGVGEAAERRDVAPHEDAAQRLHRGVGAHARACATCSNSACCSALRGIVCNACPVLRRCCACAASIVADALRPRSSGRCARGTWCRRRPARSASDTALMRRRPAQRFVAASAPASAARVGTAASRRAPAPSRR